MGETFQRRISALLLSNRRHARWAAMVACMAVLVALGVTVGLTQKGQAKTHEETVLDCQYSGGGAHTHDASCYDADGNLVCPLEEREYHVHDDSCYASETHLVCGLEEGEGAHAHDDSCYDEEGNLVCGLEESEGHVHGDGCWQTDTWLDCGLEEVTEEHVHGDGCFTTVVVTEDDPEPEADPESEATVAAPEVASAPAKKASGADMPAQEFSGELKAIDEDGNEYVKLVVTVKAPEGAFEAGTTMRVKAVDENAVAGKVDQAVKAKAGNGFAARNIAAVDITFVDKSGDEVEPAKKIEVKITSDAVKDVDQPTLVHVDRQNNAEVVNDVAKVNADDSDTSTGNENTIRFDADDFSPYIVTEVVEEEPVVEDQVVETDDEQQLQEELAAATETVYNYEDGNIKVVATLSDPTAVPDDAKFIVTPVTGNGDYDYDAYMEALNRDAEEGQEFTSDNTLLYDMGFFHYMDVDGVVKQVEFEPAAGTVNVSIEFKKAQLSEGLGATDSDKISVTHLELDETIKSEIDTTADAQGITADDIVAQDLAADVTVGDADTVVFTTDSFSIFAIKELKDNDDGTYDLMLSVTGTSSSVTTYNDINVIFIMDASQSMTFRATSETGSMVTWNALTGTIWGNSSYLDSFDTNTAHDTGTAYYYNLYEQTGTNTYQRIDDNNTTPLGDLYVKNGRNYYKVSTISGTPIRVSGSNTDDPTPRHDSSGSTSHADTRLTKTREALNSVMRSLAAKNTDANPDAVEMFLITFNGSAVSQNQGNWSTGAITIPTDYAYYTRWDLALSAAQTAAQNKKTAEASKEGGPDDTYVIFITDGTPTSYDDTNRRTAQNAAYDLNTNYGGLHLVFAYGSDTSGNLQNLSHTGLYEAKSTEALVSALTSIIGQINNANAYEQVVYNDGVTSLTTSLVAKDIRNITFKKYRTVIEENGKYYYEDNYDTNKTEAPAANIATTTGADGNSVKYDETTGVVYNAGYTYADNALNWNVSDERLEKGWLYTCAFTVWPSQEAYDLVADLNNGNRTWSSLSADERACIRDASGQGTGPFSLKTNTDGTKISYNEIKSQTSNKLPDGITQQGTGYAYNGHTMTQNSDGSYTYKDGNTVYKLTVQTNPETGGTTYTLVATTPGEAPVTNPEPVALEDGKMRVQKVWDDDINARNEANGVIFYLWKDGQKTKTKNGSDRITLPIGTGEDAVWYDTIDVAPGLMTVENGVVDVKETGHNYTLTEEIPSGIAGEYSDYNYEFSAQTVRPMEVNGHLKYLILVQEPYYTPDGAQTYDIPNVEDHQGNTITGGTYYEASAADNATLKGENHKTSELDITKQIDATLSDKTEEELDQETFTYQIVISTPEGAKDHGIKLWTYTPTEEGGYTLPEYGDLRVSGSDQGVSISGNTATVTATINRTQILRLTNLPTGTTYRITETQANNDTLANQGYVISGVGQSDSASRPTPTAGATTASGTIEKTDTRYYNNFSNKIDAVDAELKVTKALDGYEWSEGDKYTFTVTPSQGAPMPGSASVTVDDPDDLTASFGMVRFAEPGVYTYTITENNAGRVVNGVKYGEAEKFTVSVVRGQDGKLHITGKETDKTTYTPADIEAVATFETTITNTYATVNVEAHKAWLNANGTDAAPEGAEVTFTLYANGEPTNFVVVLDGEPDEAPTGADPAAYENQAWVAKFVNLPQYDDEDKIITYTVAETITWPGYNASANPQATYPEDYVATEPGGTITNEQGTKWVQFVKVGDTDTTLLAGATFTFTLNGQTVTMTSGKDGVMKSGTGESAVSVFALPISSTTTFDLTETVAPDGYNKLSGVVAVSTAGEKVTWTYGTNTKTATGSGTEADPYVVKIANSSGVELPNSGGPGTTLFTITGSAVLAMAVTYGIASRRRRERGSV